MPNDFKSVRYQDLKENPAYKQLVESVYREQASIQVQRAYRKYLTKKGKKPSLAVKNAVTKSDSFFKVIQEPTDNKYLEHANHIQNQRYDLLAFDDTEFVRNLYKCFRHKEINLNQMYLALQLYQARDWLKSNLPNDYRTAGQIHQFRYDDPKGPYQALKEISYAKELQIKKFYAALKNIEDQSYYTINFTGYEEYFFFKEGLLNYSLLSTKKFKNMLTAYLKNKASFFKTDAIERLIRSDNAEKIQAHIDELLGEETIKRYEAQKETCAFQDSASFLCAVLTANEDNPSYQLSPDYSSINKKSPTLCFVITTLHAENELQHAVHGEEVMLSALSAGKLTMRMIRALDEHPKKSENEEKSASQTLNTLYEHQYKALSHQARPVEITHPDLIKTAFPHDRIIPDFLLGWHDRFHAWRCGANFKAAIRHERALLTRRGICQQQDFIMTHGIWLTLDKDIYLGKSIRSSSIYTIDSLYHDFFSNILFRARAIDENRDLFLLNFIDMIKNSDVWNSFLPEKAQSSSFRELITHNERLSTHPLAKAFNDVHLIETIEQHKEKSNESIILRCRLRNLPDAMALCDIADAIGLEKLFIWTMNEGLQTKTEAFGLKILLDDLHSPEQLATLLKQAIHTLGNDAQRHYIGEPGTLEKLQWHEEDITNPDTSGEILRKVAKETGNVRDIEIIKNHKHFDKAVAIALLSNKKVFPSETLLDFIHDRFHSDEHITLLVRHHPCKRVTHDMVSLAEMLQIAQLCQDPSLLKHIAAIRDLSPKIQMAMVENKHTTPDQLLEIIEKNNVTSKFLIKAAERDQKKSFKLLHTIFLNKKVQDCMSNELLEKKSTYDQFIQARAHIIAILNDNEKHPAPNSTVLALFSGRKKTLEQIADITIQLNQAWSIAELHEILNKLLQHEGPDWYSKRIADANAAISKNITTVNSQKR